MIFQTFLTFLAASALPGAALAHASERMVLMTLPTGYYLYGAALIVGVTALVGALAPRLPDLSARRLFETRAARMTAISCGSALLLAALIVIGLVGSRDPLANPLPLMIWTLIWIGMTLVSMTMGNLWRGLNPWSGPVRLARRALGRDRAAGLARLGYLPAILGLFGFYWFQLVSLEPEDPAVLARVVALYWLVIFVLGLLEGEEWLWRGEALCAFFDFISRMAPVWSEAAGPGRRRWIIGPPGSQILTMPPLSPGAALFVTLALAGVTFDGLHHSFWWLARVGINPLDFPGRSAVTGVNTLGLIGAWALTFGAILGAVALGRWIGGPRIAFWQEAGPVMLAFLPIAAGYHLAHYLVALIGNGQYALLAFGDPLGRGWNPFGLPDHWVSFGFLSDRSMVLAIWNLQFAIILGAHLLAVLLGLRLAERDGPAPSLAAQAPLGALMVAYTVLGLWLLSTPTGA